MKDAWRNEFQFGLHDPPLSFSRRAGKKQAPAKLARLTPFSGAAPEKPGFGAAKSQATIPSVAFWIVAFHIVAMVKGQKVVCINDVFSPTIRALYKQLPVQDTIYTVREVFLGREKIVRGGETATVGLLLEELKNPPDPFHQGQQELGFSSERFAPLNELPDEKVEEEIAVGAWAPVT